MRNKIIFIIPTLFAGGAERVISFVSQSLDHEKFEVKLVVVGFERDSKFEIKGISVIYLNKNRVLNALLPIIILLKKEQPDIVVSSISHLNTMMGLISHLFRKIIFIGRHATIGKVAVKYKTKKKKTFLSLFSKFYKSGIKNLDYIICQSLDMKKDFLDSNNYDPSKIRIIHNPITQVDLIQSIGNKTSEKKFITIGRLSKIKGQLRLLDILSKLTIPFKLTIIGDGSYKEKIFAKIKVLNLENKIDHINYTDDVFSHLVKHDLFLQGSYSEGFPNALLESCSVGVPVLAFNVPGGTKEIITNNVNGFLVEDEEEFLKRLYDDRNWNPNKVREHVYKRFNQTKILNDYEKLFKEVIKENK